MSKFCYMPWHGLAITASGDIKPCCQWRGTLGKVSSNNLSSIYNNDKIQSLRQSFLNGDKPISCSSCWEREEMIGTSRRIWFTDKFVEPTDEVTNYTPLLEEIKWYQADVNLSNVCNLKCRMCGSWASNQWFEEELELSKLDKRYLKSNIEHPIIQHDATQLTDILTNLKYIKRIDFKGGEPMLAKNHVEFLEEIINKGYSNQITLQYTTNGTVVNPKILEALSKFKNVRLMFSIEGTGTLYEYIRGGKYTLKDLDYVISNYNKLPNVNIGFNVTIQAYNLINLKKLYNFLQELEKKYSKVSASQAFTTICNSPVYLSPFVLPMNIRETVIEELSSIDDFSHLTKSLKSDDTHQLHWDTFVSFTNDLDKLRNENVLNIIPEFRKYWNESNSSN
jgi:radical SAM protein with 4Fe4S-binding SPASM domain